MMRKIRAQRRARRFRSVSPLRWTVANLRAHCEMQSESLERQLDDAVSLQAATVTRQTPRSPLGSYAGDGHRGVQLIAQRQRSRQRADGTSPVSTLPTWNSTVTPHCTSAGPRGALIAVGILDTSLEAAPFRIPVNNAELVANRCRRGDVSRMSTVSRRVTAARIVRQPRGWSVRISSV